MVDALDTPENRAKTAEFERMAAEDDAKRTAAAKVFDPKQLLERASKIRVVSHPTLGLLKYGELTLEDSFEINKGKTDEDKTVRSVYFMLKKAYPELKLEDICKLPLIEAAELLKYISEQPAFLSPKNNFKAGSKKTKMHKR